MSDEKTIKEKLDDLKSKSVEAQIKALQKKFGSDFICKLEDLPTTESLPTRFYTLNKAIGIGGLPKGRITEVVGPEGCGKSTFALTLLADAQNAGILGAYVDLERKVSQSYASSLGVSSNTIICNPQTGDHAMMVVDQLIDTGQVGLIIIDSVALLTSQSELEKEIYDPNMALTARLLSQSLRRLVPKVAANKVCLVFINQYRKDVGKMFGNPDTPSGGKALQYGISLKMELRKGEPIKDGKVQIGHEVKFNLAKNQVGNPFSTANLKLIYGKGFDEMADIVDYAFDKEVLQMAGSWAKFNGENIAQGRGGVVELLKTDTEMYNRVYKALEALL